MFLLEQQTLPHLLCLDICPNVVGWSLLNSKSIKIDFQKMALKLMTGENIPPKNTNNKSSL